MNLYTKVAVPKGEMLQQRILAAEANAEAIAVESKYCANSVV